MNQSKVLKVWDELIGQGFSEAAVQQVMQALMPQVRSDAVCMHEWVWA